jgi:hypothetical protein
MEGDLAEVAPDRDGRWCVAFVSVFGGYACLQALRGVQLGMLVSCRCEAQAASWPTRGEAVEWLAARGLAEGSTVPVGVGHLRALVWPFRHGWWRACPPPLKGALFEVPAALLPAAKAGGPPWDAPAPDFGPEVDPARAFAWAEPPPPGTHRRNGPKRSKRELAAAVAAETPKPEPPPPAPWPELRKEAPRERADEPAVQGSLF